MSNKNVSIRDFVHIYKMSTIENKFAFDNLKSYIAIISFTCRDFIRKIKSLLSLRDKILKHWFYSHNSKFI